MLSRRTFMLSALSVPGMSLLPQSVSALNAGSTRIVAITENSCADTGAFSACLPSSILDPDPALQLLQLEKGFKDSEFQLVYGLTRDSNLVMF